MTEFWFLTGEYFFRCFVIEYSMWSTVLYIQGYSSSFYPYMHGNILIMKHCPYISHDRSILPFCCGLYGVVNSLLIPEYLHNSLNSFDVNSPPLYDLNVFIFFSMWFSINDLNSLNLLKKFIFVLHKVYPCLPRIIINKINIVYIPS